MYFLLLQILKTRMRKTTIKGQLMILKKQKLALLIGGRIEMIRISEKKNFRDTSVSVSEKESGEIEIRNTNIGRWKGCTKITLRSGNPGKKIKNIKDNMRRTARRKKNVSVEGRS